MKFFNDQFIFSVKKDALHSRLIWQLSWHATASNLLTLNYAENHNSGIVSQVRSQLKSDFGIDTS